jgi:hypothetical protein
LAGLSALPSERSAAGAALIAHRFRAGESECSQACRKPPLAYYVNALYNSATDRAYSLLRGERGR